LPLLVTVVHAWWQSERLQAVVFITTATVIYSLGHRLHTLTAVLGQLSLAPSAGW